MPKNKPYDQPTRIFTNLCRLYEKEDKSFYDVLDSLVGILNKDQLNWVESFLANQYDTD